MSQLAPYNLTDQQAALVRGVAYEKLDIHEAGRRAGYKADSVRSVLRRPAVALAIHEALQNEIQTVFSPLAIRVAGELLRNENVAPRVRADIAFKFMDRAGHITPSNKSKAPEKQLSEMTRDEMLAYIEIDKIESELAERAVDVSAPANAPSIKTLDAKPMSFLD